MSLKTDRVRRTVRPRRERRPLATIKREFNVAQKAIDRLKKELNEYEWCECGTEPIIGLLGEKRMTEDGIMHSFKKCTQPPLGSGRCSCGYALLRPDQDHWACVSWAPGVDDPRKSLWHTRKNCWEPID